MKDPATYQGFDQSVTMVSSCKNGSIFLDDKGCIRHCGTIASMSLSGNYETRDWTKFKLVTAGKRNLAIVSNDNVVFFYGGSKNNHYTTSNHETSNW